MFPELETERLRLRIPRESDVDSVFDFHADPLTKEIYRVEYSRAEIWRRIATWIGHWQWRGYGNWILEDKSSGHYIGQCGFWYPLGWDDIEIGYGIHPKHRGRGFAVEAATCVRDHGYKKHDFKRLVSYIQPTNANSIRVAEKVGAVPDGTFDMSGIAHIVYLHAKH
jgi:RimJ/RimL family protein N-acetyltransferase